MSGIVSDMCGQCNRLGTRPGEMGSVLGVCLVWYGCVGSLRWLEIELLGSEKEVGVTVAQRHGARTHENTAR